MSNGLLKQLKVNVKQHYESDSIIQLAMGMLKYNKYLDLDKDKSGLFTDKKYGTVNVLDDKYKFDNFILRTSDIEKNKTGDNLTLWEPFFYVTSDETNENDIDLKNYKMAIRHTHSNGNNNFKCKLTLRNDKYELIEVDNGEIEAKKLGKYNIYEIFMGEIGEITYSEAEVKALKKAEAATKRADDAEDQLAETKEQLTKKEKQLTIETKRADDAKAALDTANKELGETTGELEKITEQLKTSEKNLNEANAKIAEAEKQQKKAEQELKDAVNEEKKRKAQQKLEEAQRKKEEAKAKAEEAKAKAEAAATTIQSIYRRSTAKKELSDLKKEKLVEDIKKFLLEAMLKVEEIINTKMVDSKKKKSIEEIKTKISDLLGNPSVDKLEKVKQAVFK